MKDSKLVKLSGWLGLLLLASIAIAYLVVIYVAREQFNISGLMLLLALGAVALGLLVKAAKNKKRTGGA